MASQAIDYQFVPGSINPSDILSKHWGYQQVCPLLQPILFWQGNPSDLLLQSNCTVKLKGSDKCSVIQSNGKNGSASQPNGKDSSAASHADRS